MTLTALRTTAELLGPTLSVEGLCRFFDARLIECGADARWRSFASLTSLSMKGLKYNFGEARQPAPR